jgi:hypothetical protein
MICRRVSDEERGGNGRRTWSTTREKTPSEPTIVSPPSFAEHSMNIHGGSNDAAKASPSAVDTLRRYSCERCISMSELR